jgi:hypothetical protein
MSVVRFLGAWWTGWGALAAVIAAITGALH